MKLDLVALQNAVNAQLETLANQEAEDQEEAMQAAISAYCEKAGVIMVPVDEAEKLCSFLERDATWDKCGAGYYTMKRQISASQEEE